MSISSVPKATQPERHKVVITQQDGSVVRGFFCSETPTDIEELLNDSTSCFHQALASHCIGVNGDPIEIDWSSVKAIFFVGTFEGNRDQESVRFYANGPKVDIIWAEITFRDGEVVEGCLQNSLRHLTDEGFFLLPSSPGSNNHLIYVNKASIASYRALGVRMQQYS